MSGDADWRIPDTLDLVALEGSVPEVVAGWLWYCDEHDQGDSGISEEDARVGAETHRANYWTPPDPEDPEDEGEECHVLVWQRVLHERGGE